MRRRRLLLKLVSHLGCLKRAYKRRRRQLRPATWEYKEHGWWRSLEPEHAKRVEAAYVTGRRDCCAYDPKDPDVEWEYDFEYMALTCWEGAARKGGWYWIRRVMILDSGPRR